MAKDTLKSCKGLYLHDTISHSMLFIFQPNWKNELTYGEKDMFKIL